MLGKDHTTVYLDIFALEDMTAFVQTFSSAVLASLDSPTERIGRNILSFFRNCRPTMTPQDDGSVEFSFNSGSSDTSTAKSVPANSNVAQVNMM